MSGKTLKFDNNEVNKKEFHALKQAIGLNLGNINKIVIPDKFNHDDKGFRYNIIRLLCIILLQMSRYIKYFETEE